MPTRGIGRIIQGLFDAVIRPRRFVASQTSAYSRSGAQTFSQTVNIILVYLVNLVTYAGPLTIAGFGVPAEAGNPPEMIVLSTVAVDAATIWRFTLGFLQNCSYITVLSVTTLGTYHFGVVVTRNSAGFIQSLHTVVYSTSAYLAGMFTVVWYLTTTDGLSTARDFVLNVQRVAIYAIIDLLNVDVSLANGRPEQIVAGGFSQMGSALVAILTILVCYYIYSLYLGARLNHRMSQSSAILTTVAVVIAPVIYVVGSVVISLASLPVPA